MTTEKVIVIVGTIIAVIVAFDIYARMKGNKKYTPKAELMQNQQMQSRLQYELNNNSNIAGERTVYTDLKLPYKGNVTEIPLVMLNEKGAFIVQDVNVHGPISGARKDMMWHTETNRFENPIAAGVTQKHALAAYLKISEEKIYHYLVVNNDSYPEDIPWTGNEYLIVKEADLYYFMGFHNMVLPAAVSEEKLKEWNEKLKKSNIIAELSK